MSVLIKGMRIPDNCSECIKSNLRTAIKCTIWTEISTGRIKNERALCCPLVEIPEKHGRIVDADALIHELNNSHYPGAPYVDAGISIAIGKVCDAQTIVEAEDGT